MRRAARQRYLTIFVVLLHLVPAAEAQDAAAPRNVDPVLPYAPLEKQRISPDPLPNLAVPSIPGTQTIVLREYKPTLKPDQTIPPVALHVPDKFFSRTTEQPAEVWGINLLAQYPTMDPLKWPRPCRKPWCGDEIHIYLQIDRNARSEMRAKADQWSNAVLAARDDPLVVVTQQEPPSGYSQAYVEYFPKQRSSLDTKLVYVQRGADGLATEYAECDPNTINPLCSVYVEDNHIHSLQIWYSMSMKHWNQRNDVREAVRQLVRSFMPAQVSKP